MNIVINAVLAYEKPRGVGRYINNLIPQLAECDKKNNYFIYYGKWMKEYSFLNLEQDNFNFVELDISKNKIIRNLYLAMILPIKCKKDNPEVFFLIDTQAIIVKPCPIVSTIHDLAEYQTEEKYSKTHALIRQIIAKHQAKLSNHIITVSNYSQKDICRIFKKRPENVSVIYLATNMKIDSDTILPDDYFLFVSEIERAKNLMELIRAFQLLPDQYKHKFTIKVVGKKGNDYDNIKRRIEEYQLADRVEFLGYVSDKELNDLYKKAYAFIFPSYFEGFGLPILEAMAKGTPVLCSDSSSISEVGADAVLTFNPYKPDELCENMIRIIEDLDLRKNMIERGFKRVSDFSYKKTAKETIKVLENL